MRRTVIVATFVLAGILNACGTSAAPVARTGVAVPEHVAADTTTGFATVVAVSPARLETRTFASASLGRDMRYTVWLPAGYEESVRRYPTLFLLHGMGGTDRQWVELGITEAADRMTRDGEMAPFVIVMPDGGTEYWVDHANNGPRRGTSTAIDLVREVGERFRLLEGPRNRAIGGLSMGAHGALQLALNFPDTFGTVGAHSLVLRRFGSAPAYFGSQADFAKRDPMQLARPKIAQLRALNLWIDIGNTDPWVALARQFDGELTSLGVAHAWHEWPGDHSALYWHAHLADYLRFYDRGLSTRIS